VLPLIFMLSPKAVFVPAKKITHPGHWLLDVTDASGLLKRVPLAVGRDRYTVSRELLYENDPSLRHYVSQHPEVEKKASPSAPMHMGGYAPVIQSGTWRLEAGGHRPVFVMNATYEPYTIWDYGDSGAYSLWQSRRAKRTVTALFES
jgi:hypothetical protein